MTNVIETNIPSSYTKCTLRKPFQCWYNISTVWKKNKLGGKRNEKNYFGFGHWSG